MLTILAIVPSKWTPECNDLTCAENSETQMGKDVKYKLLVRALNLDTEEELAQLVSEGFTVSAAAYDPGFACMPCEGQKVVSIAPINSRQLRHNCLCSTDSGQNYRVKRCC